MVKVVNWVYIDNIINQQKYEQKKYHMGNYDCFSNIGPYCGILFL